MEGERGQIRRRLSLLEQMSAIDPGLTLDALTSAEKRTAAPQAAAPTRNQINRTLLDIIRDEEPHGGSLFGHKDKKSWKAFRDRLRLKRAGSAWTSSIHVPASDVPIQNNNPANHNLGSAYNNSRSFMSRRNSVRFTTPTHINSPESTHPPDHSTVHNSDLPQPRPQMLRRTSTRVGSSVPFPADSEPDIAAVEDGPPARSFRPQFSRRNSTRYGVDQSMEDDDAEPASEGTGLLSVALAEERTLSAREAVAAQEAAEAAAAAAEQAEGEEGEGENAAEGQTVRMSLMDLLEETDRQMGFVGSRYSTGEGEVVYEEDEEEEEEDEAEDDGGGVEHSCCVCMVRSKGAAFIPCGHTFCRLCSRELWVQRGNCPLCNGFILEILDIF